MRSPVLLLLLLLVILAAVTFAMQSLVEEEQYSDSSLVSGAVLKAKTDVNIRSGPCTWYGVKGVLITGQTVTYTGRTQSGCGYNWYSTNRGWIAAEFLQQVSGPHGGGLANGATLTATTSVNIRSGPCTTYSIVGGLGAGQTTKYTGRTASGCGYTWYSVTNGWVAAKFVREGGPSPNPGPQPGQPTGKGLDLSVFQGNVSPSTWQCLKQNGYNYAIVQAWTSLGSVNPNVNNDIARAKQAGFSNVDIYVFPDFSRGIASAGSQIAQAIDYVRGGGQTFGMVWLDIEAPNLWGQCSENVAFLQAMVAAGQRMGVEVGIYTSESQWQPIACGSTVFSHLKLWYPHYDYTPNFSDFQPFGGWSSPFMKQYTGTTSICGTQIDQNIR